MRLVTTTPIAHLCFGGVGGQSTAARTLASSFARLGIGSGLIAVGRQADFPPDNTWDMFERQALVPLRHRSDVHSMLGVHRAVKAMEPRVVLCHTHRHAPAAFTGLLSLKQMPRLVTVEHHSVDLRSPADNLRSAIALLLSSAVVHMSPLSKQHYPLRKLHLIGPSREFVVPNGVAIQSPSSIERGPGVVVGMASRLVSGKRVDELIRAVASLRNTRPDLLVRLRIAGDGTEKPRLDEMVRNLELREHVDLLGEVAASKMMDFFSSLHIYAHITEGENLSFSLIEAAQVGLPIVASQVPGVESVLIDGWNATLVRLGDTKQLASAIEHLATSPDALRLGAMARESIRASFNDKSMTHGYLRVCAQVDPTGPWSEVAATLEG